MTGTWLSAVGFVLLFGIGIGIELSARTSGSVPPAGRALAAAMRSRPGRVAVLSWWLWLGIHFLAR